MLFRSTKLLGRRKMSTLRRCEALGRKEGGLNKRRGLAQLWWRMSLSPPAPATCPTHRDVGLAASGTIMVWRLGLRSGGNFERTLRTSLIRERLQHARIECQDFRGRSCVEFKETTSAVKIFLHFLRSKLELGSRGTGVGYKIPPAKVRGRSDPPGTLPASDLG